ncbi:MAG: outer membrane protein assembly factor BamD [Tepidisphaeraceae bacterium]
MSRPSPSRFSRLANLAWLGGVLLCAIEVMRIIQGGDMPTGELLTHAAAALAYLLAGLVASSLLKSVSAILSRVDELSRQMSQTAADQATILREIAQERAAPAPPAPHAEMVEDAPPPVPYAAPPTDPMMEDRILNLLEEIREVTLMNDEQRQVRLQQLQDSRKSLTLDQIYYCFREGQWARSEQLLASMEQLFPGDGMVVRTRGELMRLRAAAESETWDRARDRVNDLVSVSSWDKAITAATEFVGNFPTHVEGRHLLTRVRREYDIARDSSFQRMYEEVQADVDRKSWREALEGAQRLLEAFPTHARANKIRRQLKTIADNAEIEERQEHEMKIQQLVRGRRFAEAVELAEDVLKRYPGSPQAQSLDVMLPKLRDLAEHGDDAETPSQEPAAQS